MENVVNRWNCLDYSKSVFEEDEKQNVLSIQNYVFRPERIGVNTLFRLPERRLKEIFVLNGEAGEDLYTLCIEAKLTGLTFTEVWNSSDGSVGT